MKRRVGESPLWSPRLRYSISFCGENLWIDQTQRLNQAARSVELPLGGHRNSKGYWNERFSGSCEFTHSCVIPVTCAFICFSLNRRPARKNWRTNRSQSVD